MILIYYFLICLLSKSSKLILNNFNIRRKSMKKLLGILLLTLSMTAWADHEGKPHATTPPAPPTGTIAMCGGDHPSYEYALCAASTCTKTGNIIYDNAGTRFQEVSCACPILKGKSVAWLDGGGGNMGPTCASKKGEVWSLFAPHVIYPQQANHFVKHPKTKQKAVVQKCPQKLSHQSSNCFSFKCTRAGFVNGTPVADCRCPIGQIKNNEGVNFLTEAGQGDPHACSENPVAAPDPETSKKLNKVYNSKK
jgi:hypothetical protein